MLPPDFNKPPYMYALHECPIPVAASTPPLSFTDARKPGRAAGIAQKGEKTKFKAACDANGATRVITVIIITNLY
jgi:hypothetical protein